MITHASEENRQSLQAQLVPECCSMRDRNQPAAGSSSISEKYQGAKNAFSAVRLLRSRDQRNLTLCTKLLCACCCVNLAEKKRAFRNYRQLRTALIRFLSWTNYETPLIVPDYKFKMAAYLPRSGRGPRGLSRAVAS